MLMELMHEQLLNEWWWNPIVKLNIIYKLCIVYTRKRVPWLNASMASSTNMHALIFSLMLLLSLLLLLFFLFSIQNLFIIDWYHYTMCDIQSVELIIYLSELWFWINRTIPFRSAYFRDKTVVLGMIFFHTIEFWSKKDMILTKPNVHTRIYRKIGLHLNKL